MTSGAPEQRWQHLCGSLDARQWRNVSLMAAVVLGLHAVGFMLLFALGSPSRHVSGALTVGVGLTAYTLGMRHAFDADHICAIDNATRKLIADGKRPLSVGFWFSLGHSTIVFALSLLIALGVRSLDGSISSEHSSLQEITGWVGTTVSGAFLYLLAALNTLVLRGLLKALRQIRVGRSEGPDIAQHPHVRGPMSHVFGRATRIVKTPARMYPVGVLFGLGFDTASEVALLVIAASAGAAGLPWYSILCLPVLFAAGMSLFDSLDGALMSFAYEWAHARPARRLYYNITITGLSVAVGLLVATIELGGLIAGQLHLSGPVWDSLQRIDISTLGYIIAGLFAATWTIALAYWHLGHVEERYRPTLTRE